MGYKNEIKMRVLLTVLQLILIYTYCFSQNINAANLPKQFQDYKIFANLDSLEYVALSYKNTPSVFLHELIQLELNRNTRSDKFGQSLDTIKILSQQQSSELGLMMYEYLKSTNAMKNNLEEGIRAATKILDYFEYRRDTLGVLLAYQQIIRLNLSASSKVIGSKESAKNYLHKAFEWGKNNSNVHIKLLILKLKLSFLFDLLGSTDFKDATNSLHEVERLIAQNPQYEHWRGGFYGLCAYFCHKINMRKEELQYAEKAYKYTLTLPLKNRLIPSLNLGAAHKNNLKYATAENTFKETINLYNVSKEDRPELLSTLYLYVSEMQYKQHKYEDAWRNRNTGDSLTKITQDKIRSRNLLEIQTKYETEKKELENKKLALEADKQRQKAGILGFLALLFILISGATVWTYRKVKEKNKELLRLNELTISQNKDLMSANQRMEHFTNVLSHDALGYINHILNYTILSQNIVSQTELLSPLQKILKNATSLKNMSENLVSYNQTTHDIQSQNFDLNDIVSEIAEDMSFEFSNSDIRLESHDLPHVFANREFTKQILRNLITNAIKFKKKDSPLNIEICEKERKEDNLVEIFIKDNGLGISAEQLPYIFNEFVQGDSKISGSGLGLYICRQIIEKMGGSIWAESTLKEGSTFYFTLKKAGN